jgi:alpha-tubulin suppressor-like RCC1 family protein
MVAVLGVSSEVGIQCRISENILENTGSPLTWGPPSMIYTLGSGNGSDLGQPNSIRIGTDVLETYFYSTDPANSGSATDILYVRHRLSQLIPPDTKSHLSAGALHTCFIKTRNDLNSRNDLKCWGLNTSGQLGIGSTLSQTLAEPNQLLNGNLISWPQSMIKVKTSATNTCGISQEKIAFCTGLGTYYVNGNQLATLQPSPVAVMAVSSGLSITDLSLNNSSACAIVKSLGSNEGSAQCWGFDSFGQLGNGSLSVTQKYAFAVSDLADKSQQISTGLNHSCAVVKGSYGANTEIVCWGLNNFGQLGDGTFGNSESPVRVIGDFSSGVMSLELGGNRSCAILTNGYAYCWGSNENGELGDGTNRNQPTPQKIRIGSDLRIKFFALGSSHTCATTHNGQFYCWGLNTDGQLGYGTKDNTLAPNGLPVGLGASVVASTAGKAHTCVFLSNKQLMCWGSNLYGQLGFANLQLESKVPIFIPQ